MRAKPIQIKTADGNLDEAEEDIRNYPPDFTGYRTVLRQIRRLEAGPLRTNYDIEAVCRYLFKRRPSKVVVEIGVAGGASMLMLTRNVVPGATVIGVDLPAYRAPWHASRAAVFKSLEQEEDFDVHLILGRSCAVIGEVQQLLAGRKVDLLHIDGDHTWDSVEADFDTYAHLVVDGGCILMHDIHDYYTGVPAFWEALRGEYHKNMRVLMYGNRQGFQTGAIEM